MDTIMKKVKKTTPVDPYKKKYFDKPQPDFKQFYFG
jgi:hypothetical protein